MTEPANPGPRLTGWLLRLFQPRPGIRPWSLRAGLVASVVVIGLVDYWSGAMATLSFFYLIPVALAVPWLGWRSAVVLSVFSGGVRVAADLLGPDADPAPAISGWNAGLMVLIFGFVIWLLQALLALHATLEKRVLERTKALEQEVRARRQLEREVLGAGSRERSVIWHELHDDLCQHLVGTALAAKVLAERSGERAPEALAIVELLEEGIAKTRRIARGLLLAEIPPDRLVAELTDFAASACREHGVVCRFEQQGTLGLREPAVAAQLFRIAQEATRNAVRHSGASEVIITLQGNGDALRLCVEDDGFGFAAARERGDGMGLRIMAHRSAMIGGKLAIEALDPRGTRVVCVLPRERIDA